MALSYQTYNGNGATATFSLAFTGGGPLRKDHVAVTVNGVTKTRGVHYDIDNALATLTFVAGSIPASGEKVVIKRTTPFTESTRVVDFVSGSVLTAKDLDDANVSNLYVTQENADKNVLVYDPVAGNVDGGGVVVTNVEFDFGTI